MVRPFFGELCRADCLRAMVLRALSIVLLTIRAYQNKAPEICWIRFVLGLSRSAVSSSGNIRWALFPYCTAGAWNGECCGVDGVLCWNRRTTFLMYPGTEIVQVRAL